ncbi:unnamed protein product [Zymoseptoria tritici ST99CH_1E4]|uniref:Retinoic acid induced 16-like protein-domain-containing protein n=1 Tax=Zymoseptoria tritici ST99CH_1E4 TaxID=1276532 RepID=A0A2H1G6U9_ZYMTR|nr:unnamed protein product [Zymoseptoria tritici ST99CH_1E4]
MDFWARLLPSYAPKKATARPASNDAHARLIRFKRVYNTFLELCDRPRNPTAEEPLLDSLRACLEKVAALLREESRAPAPHTCLQFAGSSRIYTVIARAAGVSQYEPLIRASISVFAALVDSEEEDFLSSGHFAKSLMALVRKTVDSAELRISGDTETSVLELMFTIAAKIRLQPEILPVWFHSTAKPEMDDVFLTEKKSFVGVTQKDDFPLCYLLIERVHLEGRIGDFARTGLLYIFESTGRSPELEEWVVSSDLPTLMASGLGALYSQLSRELSILHPDASLPAVLAMSDYTTSHTRPTAESAFSERHKAHMATFLSYLAFWQDVLDHCRSADVKQTLLDHFQILFLQQLLYPSLLQSSDTDAGSSVAVLTYMTAMLEALDYPDLIHMILTYLLAIQDPTIANSTASLTASASPTTVKRRQSLLLLAAPKDTDGSVDPDLFNLVDLIMNDVRSRNSQTVFAALKVMSAIVIRHKKYAFGTLLKVRKDRLVVPSRTVGALTREAEQYAALAVSLHPQYEFNTTYASLCQDLRLIIESQLSTPLPTDNLQHEDNIGAYVLEDTDPLLRIITAQLRSFFTNHIDVNLALTQAIICIAQCVELRLEDWVCLAPSAYTFEEHGPNIDEPWQTHVDNEDRDAWSTAQQATREPDWRESNEPVLFKELKTLVASLDAVRSTVPNLDQLIAGRKVMLQATSLEAAANDPSSLMQNFSPSAFDDSPKTRTAATSISGAGDADTLSSTADARSGERQPSSTSLSANSAAHPRDTSPTPLTIFKPPPPETPSTTDMLMQGITFAAEPSPTSPDSPDDLQPRTASLNHVLTNVVVLQEFVLELVAVLQMRAAVLGDREVRSA